MEDIIQDTELAVPGQDTLGYSYSLKYLSVKICYYLDSDSPGDPPLDFMKADLAQYINSLANNKINVEIQDIYSYFLEEYAGYFNGIDFSESECEMSILLPDGNEVVYSLGTNTSLEANSTREYYNDTTSGSSIKVYDYLPSNYLTDMQVGDATCQVYLDVTNIILQEA